MDTAHTETALRDTEPLPSNWGRWGEDDQLGTLNLVDAEARARGAAEVQVGRSVSLALPVEPTPLISGPFAPPTQDGSAVQQVMAYLGSPTPSTADVILVTNHHPRSTHLDALGHVVRDARVYPGRPLDQAVTPAGVAHGSTTAFAAGVVTRGVLLDLAVDGPLPSGYPVTGRDLDAAEERQRVRIESGDALVVRCGWAETVDPENPMPGMSLDAVRWMHRRGVALYVGDIGDGHPGLDPTCPLPLHLVALPLMGMPLVDAAKVDDLAAVCAEMGRYGFLFVAAPPRIHGLTGVPVNPLAVF